MYNFDILIKREEDPEMDASFEELDIDIAKIEYPDIEPEFVSATLNARYFEDYQKAYGILLNVRKHLMEHGCTTELVQIMNPQLLDHGIILEVGRKSEAMYSIESLMENIDVNKIKETLMKIIDAIINLIQKFIDQNKNDTNALKELLRTKLADTSKYDTRKFAAIVGAVYTYDDFVDLAKGFTGIMVSDEVEGDTDLSKAISSKLSGLLETAGYEISSDSITRDENFSIPKERMERLGWAPAKLRNAAELARIMLETIRKKHKLAIGVLKKEVSDFDGDAEGKVDLMNKLNNTMRAIAAIERISLILSRQVTLLCGLLKTKEGVSNESIYFIGEEVDNKDADFSFERINVDEPDKGGIVKRSIATIRSFFGGLFKPKEQKKHPVVNLAKRINGIKAGISAQTDNAWLDRETSIVSIADAEQVAKRFEQYVTDLLKVKVGSADSKVTEDEMLAIAKTVWNKNNIGEIIAERGYFDGKNNQTWLAPSLTRTAKIQSAKAAGISSVADLAKIEKLEKRFAAIGNRIAEVYRGAKIWEVEDHPDSVSAEDSKRILQVLNIWLGYMSIPFQFFKWTGLVYSVEQIIKPLERILDVQVATESMDAEVDTKDYKKKNHVENCPCMDKDATSCECKCPFEEDDSMGVGDSTNPKVEIDQEIFDALNALIKSDDRVAKFVGDKNPEQVFAMIEDRLEHLDDVEGSTEEIAASTFIIIWLSGMILLALAPIAIRAKKARDRRKEEEAWRREEANEKEELKRWISRDVKMKVFDFNTFELGGAFCMGMVKSLPEILGTVTESQDRLIHELEKLIKKFAELNDDGTIKKIKFTGPTKDILIHGEGGWTPYYVRHIIEAMAELSEEAQDVIDKLKKPNKGDASDNKLLNDKRVKNLVKSNITVIKTVYVELFDQYTKIFSHYKKFMESKPDVSKEGFGTFMISTQDSVSTESVNALDSGDLDISQEGLLSWIKGVWNGWMDWLAEQERLRLERIEADRQRRKDKYDVVLNPAKEILMSLSPADAKKLIFTEMYDQQTLLTFFDGLLALCRVCDSVSHGNFYFMNPEKVAMNINKILSTSFPKGTYNVLNARSSTEDKILKFPKPTSLKYIGSGWDVRENWDITTTALVDLEDAVVSLTNRYVNRPERVQSFDAELVALEQQDSLSFSDKNRVAELENAIMCEMVLDIVEHFIYNFVVQDKISSKLTKIPKMVADSIKKSTGKTIVINVG